MRLLEERGERELFQIPLLPQRKASVRVSLVTIARIKDQLYEHVDIDASKRISKQLALDLHKQFDLLAKITNSLVIENIALKAYNKGLTHVQERINAKIEGLADFRDRPTYASKMGKKVPPVTGRTTKKECSPSSGDFSANWDKN